MKCKKKKKELSQHKSFKSHSHILQQQSQMSTWEKNQQW